MGKADDSSLRMLTGERILGTGFKQGKIALAALSYMR